MTLRLLFALVCLATAAFPQRVVAQASGVPIEDPRSLMQNPSLLEKAKALRDAGKLLDVEKVKTLLAAPVPSPIELPVANTKPLRGREIAERARRAYFRLGWYYLCPRCGHWHFSFANAYAISADGAIASCHHVVAPTRETREGYLVALDPAGEILAVTTVLAKSQTLDAAIVRVEGGTFTPLPLNDNVAPGDPVFCLSDPLDERGYFSEGIVNRFYWKRAPKGDLESLDALKNLRVNVSTDWAPGSSGAAVLDQCGNAIGHVSTISPLSEGAHQPAPAPEAENESEKAKPAQARNDRFNGATLITLHEAVPARGLLALAKTINVEAAKVTAPSEGSAPEKPAP
jgi:hypothetical protein